ncbi:hypothetical protein F4805DRAFT_474124 [Annulohypoxylon moriforme]|nr:hypothetical protein F4805DRAFT_474124 [Annulohypoxylon moriforme]
MPTETHSRDEYTVGWVCALPKEQTAAIAMLDQRHSLPHDMQKSKQDSNTYNLGSVSCHNVVIACLPMGRYGTISAATVVAHMVETFPSIRFGLMVGIGGGVPPNVRLGDVVVSVPIGEHPGVVQWDLGKVEDGCQFKRTGSLDKPPTVLLTALSTLQTYHDLEGSNMETYLQDWEKKYPKSAAKYTKTDALQDELFKEGYSHVQDSEVGNDTSEGSFSHRDKRQAVERKPLETQIHYGLIASGNSVIKDAAFRDTLNKRCGGNVLCVEMEAAGLMDNFPCIVIRGICDYADSRKNKTWQEYAAAISAAFAKEFLGYVQLGDVVQQQPAKDILGHITKIEDRLARHESTQDRNKLLRWLTSFNYGSRHSDILRKRYSNTNQWFLQHKTFSQWSNTKGVTLYCPGIQGAGKTVLTATIIQHLELRFQNEVDVGVAYIYCDYYSLPVTLEGYLSRLLKQLIAQKSSIPSEVEELYRRHEKKGTRATHQELLGVLEVVLGGLNKAFIIIDALDECKDTEDGHDCREQLTSAILSLQETCKVNIFATSRIVKEIKVSFMNSLTIGISADTNDVENYLYSRISLQEDNLFDSGFRKKVVSKITKAADGMFLLAELHMNSLKDLPTKGHMEHALSTLTTTSNKLDSAYKCTLERIKNQGPECSELAYQTLAWVVHAMRPLYIRELRHALATQPGMKSFNANFRPNAKKLLSICAGLITSNTDEENGTIRLIHYTTEEYLLKSQNEWYPNIHGALTTTCITYLSFEDFDKEQPQYSKLQELYPFHGYATKFWFYHAKESQSCDWQMVVSFLEKKIDVCKIQRWDVSYSGRRVQVSPEELRYTTLHLATYFDLQGAVQLLYESGHNVDPKNIYGETPLMWAAAKGNEAMVEQLLDLGADSRMEDKYGKPPIFFAADKNHSSIMELLSVCLVYGPPKKRI